MVSSFYIKASSSSISSIIRGLLAATSILGGYRCQRIGTNQKKPIKDIVLSFTHVVLGQSVRDARVAANMVVVAASTIDCVEELFSD